MAYCNEADVMTAAGGSKRLRQLVDWNSDTFVDAPEVLLAIDSAQAEIDSYVAKRFAPPVAAPIPESLRWKCADLAVLELKERRDTGMLTDADHLKRERITKWLEALAKGDVLPGIQPLPTASSVIVDKVVDRADTDGLEYARNETAGYW